MEDFFVKACKENIHSLVSELLSEGADVNWRDDDGEAGLHITASDNYGELLELLLAQTEVNVNTRDDGNTTPLWLDQIILSAVQHRMILLFFLLIRTNFPWTASI